MFFGVFGPCGQYIPAIRGFARHCTPAGPLILLARARPRSFASTGLRNSSMARYMLRACRSESGAFWPRPRRRQAFRAWYSLRGSGAGAWGLASLDQRHSRPMARWEGHQAAWTSPASLDEKGKTHSPGGCAGLHRCRLRCPLAFAPAGSKAAVGGSVPMAKTPDAPARERTPPATHGRPGR